MKVFIIHGWTYNLDKWQPIVPLLQAQGLEPIMLKVPGLTAPSQKVWDIDDYVSWLDAQLAHEKRPVVIGHSNGGRIALAYAQAHPGRLGQLILIDSAGVAHNQLVPRAKLRTLKGLSKIGKPLAAVPPIKKLFYKIIGAQDYRDAPPNMRKTMQHMLAADQSIDFSRIHQPVTIIWGRDDTITPLKDAHTLHAGLAGSALHVINGARHAPFFTNPDQVAAIIKESLDH